MKAQRTSEDVKERITRRMAVIDNLTPKQRAVVHDYGWGVVQCLRDVGVIDPKKQIMVINKVLIELSNDYREIAARIRRLPPPPFSQE